MSLHLFQPSIRIGTRRTLLPLCIALATSMVISPAQSQAVVAQQSVIAFDLPAGKLSTALNTLARQAGLTVSVDPVLLEGKAVDAYVGNVSVQQALHHLFVGSGLGAQVNDGAIIVSSLGVTTLRTVTVSGGALGQTTEGTGSYATGAMKSSTGLSLSARDTPQAVSVVTRQRIEDQSMDSVADALRSTPGISVKATDRGRNSVSSRGFVVSSYQIDGVPFATGNIGIETASTAIYDRVEIVRGATGLTSGSGDPSATVNLIRKHAYSREFSGEVELEGGSWDRWGGTADMSMPLTADGSVRARVVGRYVESEAFIDLESTENSVFYAVVDADLSEQTFLTFGGSYEKTERDGVYWGQLPYFFSDGSRTDWNRSKTTATRWNQWDTKETTLFASLEQTLKNEWVLGADASYYEQEEYSDLLWLMGEPDRVTGEGMTAYPYLYVTKPEQYQISVSASGPFQTWGRQHEAMFRLLHSEQKGGWDNGGEPLSPIPEVGNFYEWDGSYPKPIWNEPEVSSRNKITQTAFQGAAHFQLSDALKAILGGRLSNWKTEEEAAAWTSDAYEIHHDDVFIPYVGFIYDVSNELSAYASYSSIFKPQAERDRNGNYLDPLKGDTYELGMKGEYLDGALNASATLFAIRQDNYAVPDGNNVIPGTAIIAARAVSGVESDGYELEVTGALTPNWDIAVSWTQFSAEGPDGEEVAVEHPRKMLRLFTKYHLHGAMQGISVGTGLTWQDDEPRRATNPATGLDEHVGEGAYAVVDLMAEYRVDKQWSLQLNVYNLFDKEYKESSWGTFTYGEPRNALLSAKYQF